MTGTGPVVSFDHLMHWVPDLEAAIAAYGELGFTLAPQIGQHPGRGTHNTAWRTGAAYIELIGVRDQAEAEHARGPDWPPIDALLRAGGGAGAFAVLVADVTATVARLREQGLPVTDPRPGSVTRADGTVGEWSLAVLREGPPWRPFFINYGMDPAAWAERWRALGFPRDPWLLDHLVIETPDPDGSAA